MSVDQWFTPEWLSDRISDWVIDITRASPDASILEPSAGRGSLLLPILRDRPDVTAVELDLGCCVDLRAEIGDERVVEGDFLEVGQTWLEEGKKFSLGLLNPPYLKEKRNEIGLDVKFALLAGALCHRCVGIFRMDLLAAPERFRSLWGRVILHRVAILVDRPRFDEPDDTEWGSPTGSPSWNYAVFDYSLAGMGETAPHVHTLDLGGRIFLWRNPAKVAPKQESEELLPRPAIRAEPRSLPQLDAEEIDHSSLGDELLRRQEEYDDGVREEKRLPIAVGEFHRHGHEESNCSRCQLYDARKREPKIEVHADIGAHYEVGGLMVVGEAPGRREIIEGKPFVGKSGMMFNTLLGQHTELTREDLWVSNALLCRPPNNNLDEAVGGIEGCNQRLMNEIWEARPRVILALGKTAMISLTGRAFPRALREKVHCDVCDGAGKVRHLQASWLKRDKIREAREKKDPGGYSKCTPCGGKGQQTKKTEINFLGSDFILGSIVGAPIDIHNHPAFAHLGGEYPPETKYIICTYHPAHLIRTKKDSKDDGESIGGPAYIPAVSRHLYRAFQLLSRDVHIEFNPQLLDSDEAEEDLRSFVSDTSVIYSVDIETTGDQLHFSHAFHEGRCTRCGVVESHDYAKMICRVSIDGGKKKSGEPSLDIRNEKILCVGIAKQNTADVYVVDLRQEVPALRRVLREFLGSPEHMKIGHNFSFDAGVLESAAW